MIDHRIILELLMLQSEEKNLWAYHAKNRIELVQDGSLIFFSMVNPRYYSKLKALTLKQYLERLKVLYPILGRSN